MSAIQADIEARLAETDARRAESAEVGIFHGFPVAVGFNPAIHPSFQRGFRPGCNRRFVVWPQVPVVVPVAGRGGAFMAANDRNNPAIRH